MTKHKHRRLGEKKYIALGYLCDCQDHATIMCVLAELAQFYPHPHLSEARRIVDSLAKRGYVEIDHNNDQPQNSIVHTLPIAKEVLAKEDQLLGTQYAQ